MELKIGENIKRLRREKGFTQEQLAELLNVSCAAVSKWESSYTYSDITLLMPIANVFNITLDELLGYSASQMEEEIETLIKKYNQMQYDGHFEEATAMLCDARKKYPNDYRIMHLYMWNLAGGTADNDNRVLKKNCEEFTSICDCILDGCTDEKIRLEAMTMKAKLLHANGNTKGALALLSNFPTWYESADQKSEQLFVKDSAEFGYWVRKNLYSLADFAADKGV